MKKQLPLNLEDPSDDASLLRPGKDEMNFAEFPIALLTDRVPKGQKTIKFEDKIYDERRKRVITRRRIIEGSKEYGLPTATDDTVILALIQLTKLKGNFSQREVEFSRLELIKMLGWADEGRSYDRIKLSLLRIANVTYNYDNAWWDGRQKTWTTKAFHIIDTVEINDSRTGHGPNGLFPSRIVWNDVVFDSFQAGFLRDIDFHLCMQLEHPTALRMYRYLGKRFYVRPDWVFDLKEFAHDHIGIGRNYEGGTQIARKLKPAISELEEVGFLEPLPERERFIKKGREWSIRFVQKINPPGLPSLPLSADDTNPDQRYLIAGLSKRGVTAKTAAELVQESPAEFIRQQIEVFDWLMENQHKRLAKNPAGYLVKSILDKYENPKDFVPEDERQRREEAGQARERQASEARRHQQEEKAREQSERQAAIAYWQSLTPEQQVELDAASLALADPETLALEHGPMKRMGKQIRRDSYIRQLLSSTDADSVVPKSSNRSGG
jgi:hypothetical protein